MADLLEQTDDYQTKILEAAQRFKQKKE